MKQLRQLQRYILAPSVQPAFSRQACQPSTGLTYIQLCSELGLLSNRTPVHDIRMRVLQVSFFAVCIWKYYILTDICLYHKGAFPMSDTLPNLLNLRGDLLRQVSQLGDFQPGSVTRVHRRCGKPNCHCAKPTDAGHGPQVQLTHKMSGKTVTQTLSSLAAVRKVEKEIAAFRRFQSLTHDLVEVNQKICRLRPVEGQEQSAQEKKRRKRSSRKSSAK